MGYKPNISYRQVTNEKINYLRTQISSCDEIIGKNTKEIYQELINQEYSNNLSNIADFELLYKEKISKLKETGFKTLHNAHRTALGYSIENLTKPVMITQIAQDAKYLKHSIIY